jgi:methionyl-tRNA formyltransferase
MSPKKFPYVFFGSEPIGPIALEALRLAQYEPTLVINNPKLSSEAMIEMATAVSPTFFLVVGFGAILKRELLDVVCGQVLNIHPSLLPEYRGPAPVVQAILDGAEETGVTLMQVDTKMDHGYILAQDTLRLRGTEEPAELYSSLTRRGVELFLECIEQYLNDSIEMLAQIHNQATFTHFIKKENGLLDVRKSPQELERQIRAFQGWPRSWVMLDDKRLIIDKARIENDQLRFDMVQPENGKPMKFKEFCAGIRMSSDEVYKKLGI